MNIGIFDMIMTVVGLISIFTCGYVTGCLHTERKDRSNNNSTPITKVTFIDVRELDEE